MAFYIPEKDAAAQEPEPAPAPPVQAVLPPAVAVPLPAVATQDPATLLNAPTADIPSPDVAGAPPEQVLQAPPPPNVDTPAPQPPGAGFYIPESDEQPEFHVPEKDYQQHVRELAGSGVDPLKAYVNGEIDDPDAAVQAKRIQDSDWAQKNLFEKNVSAWEDQAKAVRSFVTEGIPKGIASLPEMGANINKAGADVATLIRSGKATEEIRANAVDALQQKKITPDEFNAQMDLVGKLADLDKQQSKGTLSNEDYQKQREALVGPEPTGQTPDQQRAARELVASAESVVQGGVNKVTGAAKALNATPGMQALNVALKAIPVIGPYAGGEPMSQADQKQLLDAGLAVPSSKAPLDMSDEELKQDLQVQRAQKANTEKLMAGDVGPIGQAVMTGMNGGKPVMSLQQLAASGNPVDPGAIEGASTVANMIGLAMGGPIAEAGEGLGALGLQSASKALRTGSLVTEKVVGRGFDAAKRYLGWGGVDLLMHHDDLIPVAKHLGYLAAAQSGAYLGKWTADLLENAANDSLAGRGIVAQLFGRTLKSAASGAGTNLLLAMPSKDPVALGAAFSSGAALGAAFGLPKDTATSVASGTFDSAFIRRGKEPTYEPPETPYGTDPALDKQSAHAIKDLPDEWKNRVNGVKQLLGDKAEVYVLPPKEFSVYAEKGAATNQISAEQAKAAGVTIMRPGDGMPQVFLNAEKVHKALYHETGHALWQYVPEDSKLAFKQAYLEHGDADQLVRNYVERYTGKPNDLKFSDLPTEAQVKAGTPRGPAGLTQETAVEEMGADRFHSLFNGQTVDQLSKDPSLARNMQFGLGRVLERFGIPTTTAEAVGILGVRPQFTDALILDQFIRKGFKDAAAPVPDAGTPGPQAPSGGPTPAGGPVPPVPPSSPAPQTLSQAIAASQRMREQLRAMSPGAPPPDTRGRRASEVYAQNRVNPNTPPTPEVVRQAVMDALVKGKRMSPEEAEHYVPKGRVDANTLYNEARLARDKAVLSRQQPAGMPNARAAQPAAPSAPEVSKPVQGFTTGKGSTYVVHEDGTTTRTKAARPEHPGDQGLKDRSERTVYLKPEDAARLAPPNGVPTRFVDHGDGTISVVAKVKDRWGVSPSQRNVPVSTRPAEGLHPLELWKKDDTFKEPAYRTYHFGNPIKSLEARAPAPKASQPSQQPAGMPTARSPVVAPPPPEPQRARAPQETPEEAAYHKAWEAAGKLEAESPATAATPPAQRDVAGSGVESAAPVKAPMRPPATVDAQKLDAHLGGLLKGHAQDFIEIGQKYGVDPHLLAAMSMFETANGMSHALREHNNTAGLMDPRTVDAKGFQSFASIRDGIEAQAQLLRRGYLDQGRTSLDAIGQKWAPPGAANDPNHGNSGWAEGVASYYKALGGDGNLVTGDPTAEGSEASAIGRIPGRHEGVKPPHRETETSRQRGASPAEEDEGPNPGRKGAAQSEEPESNASPLSKDDIAQAKEESKTNLDAQNKRFKSDDTRQKALKEAEDQTILERHAQALPPGDDRVRLQVDPDTGRQVISGSRFVPGDAVHERLLEGVPKQAKAIADQFSQRIGTNQPVHLTYHSAEAADGGIQAPTAESRGAEQAASPASERAKGATPSTENAVTVIPTSLGVKVDPKEDNAVYLKGFSPNKFLTNVAHLIDALKEKSPYDSAHDPKLAADVARYVENQRHGWKGDGSAPLQGTPELQVQVARGYAGKPLPKKHADFINAAFNDHWARGTTAKAGAIRTLAELNQGHLSPKGETNPLREEINDSQFGDVANKLWTQRTLQSPYETRRADLVKELHDAPPLDKPSLYEHNPDVAQAFSEHGLPVQKYVAAGFLPDAERASDTREKARTEGRALFLPDSQGETKRNLVALHNLSPEGVLAMERLGGVPVPSIAITKKTIPHDQFGPITLVAHPGVVDPKKGTPVFDRDVYSPRQPRPEAGYDPNHLASKTLENKVQQAIDDLYGNGSIYPNAITNLLEHDPNPSHAASELSTQLAFLKDADAAPDLTPNKFGRLNLEDSNALHEALQKNGGKKAVQKWIQDQLEPAKNEPYFKSNKSGEKRPYTLEELTREMKGKIKGQEGTQSLGEVAAKTARRFQSVPDIKSATHQLIPGREELEYHEETVRQLNKLEHSLSYEPYSLDEGNARDALLGALRDFNRYSDRKLKGLGDEGAVKQSLDRYEYAIDPDAPLPDVVRRFRSVAARVRYAPSNYFEAKPQRAVQLKEFNAAVYPEGTHPEVVRALHDAGVSHHETYRDNTPDSEEDRRAAVERAAEATKALFLPDAEKAPRGSKKERGAPIMPQARQREGVGYAPSRMNGQSDKPTHVAQTPQFKRWFGDSKVVDDKGNPLRVYHGTTHDFDAFDMSKTRPDGMWGRGHYFTDSPEDASTNYAGEGPDLTLHLEHRVQGLLESKDTRSELLKASAKAGVDPGGYLSGKETDESFAKRVARKELSGGRASVMPVYLSLKNPVVLGEGKGMELWSPLKKTGKSSKARQFLDKLESAVQEFEGKPDTLDGLRQAFEEHGIGKAEDFINLALDSDELMDVMDANRGEYVGPGGTISQALQMMGYDGIIDHTAGKRYAKMKGVNPDVTHYVAFEAQQIKSATGNTGTFSPHHADVRFLPDAAPAMPHAHVHFHYHAAPMPTQDQRQEHSVGYGQ